MKTTIFGKEAQISKEELIQFCYDEYDSLSHKDLVTMLVELDMESASFEEVWLEKFEHYDDEAKEAILARIRKAKSQ